MTSEQHMPKFILICQGVLMLGVAFAPYMTGYRFSFPDNFWDWVGTVLSILGTLLVILSVKALKENFTVQAGVRSGTELARKFPFSLSRNPMYVGGLIMCVSWSILQRSALSGVLTIFLAVVLHLKIKIEERNLENFFGNQYLKYKKMVGRYL